MFTDGKSVWREFGRVFGTVLLALVKIHVKKKINTKRTQMKPKRNGETMAEEPHSEGVRPSGAGVTDGCHRAGAES